MFKRRSKTGTENAIESSLSLDNDFSVSSVPSLEDQLPPPRQRGTWKKDESERHSDNIHMPTSADENTFQPKISARYPLIDHEEYVYIFGHLIWVYFSWLDFLH